MHPLCRSEVRGLSIDEQHRVLAADRGAHCLHQCELRLGPGRQGWKRCDERREVVRRRTESRSGARSNVVTESGNPRND
eukprot:1292316-Prymnesium_polylepis.4